MATILVVETWSADRDLILALLAEGGYRLLTAASGEAGLAVARAEHPDLIITDILMPGMDGYEFTRQVRADPALSQTQVVFYTAGFVLEEARQLAAACGVQHIIARPAQPELILKIVEQALASVPASELPPADEAFHQQHLRLLTDRLAARVAELEAENAERRRAAELYQQQVERLAEQSRTLAHLAAIVGFSHDAIISKTLDSIITSWNPAAEQMFGYSAAEALGQPMALVIPPERIEEETLIMAAIRRDERVEHFETKRRRKDGALLDVSITISPIKAADGAIVGASKIVRDISQSKRAEQALRASEERYRALMDQAADGIFISDASGAYMDVNARGCELVGYTRAEILQKNLRDLVPPEDLPRQPPRLRELQSGQTLRSERRLLHKDGTRLPVEISATLLSDGRLQGIVRDIRARQQTEQAQRDGQARLAAMIDSAMDGIITIDAGERITLFNRAAEHIFGYSAADMLGQPLSRLLPPAFRAAHQAHVRGFGATGVTARAMGALQPLSGLRADGSEFPIEAAISQIEVAGQKLYTVILRDVTERQRAEARNAYQARVLAAVNDAVLATDAKFNVTLWNPAAVAMYGWPEAEVLGKFAPDIVKSEYPGILSAQLRRELVEIGFWRGEVTQARRDGTRFPVDVSTIVLRDANGQVSGIVSVARDISERKRIEADLAQKASLLNLAHNAIIVRDAHNVILFWNHGAEETYGWSEAEALGQVTDTLLATQFPISAAEVQAALATQLRWAGELVHTTRAGRQITVISRQVVQRDAHGQTNAILEINNDISERKEAEAALARQAVALRRSNAELEQFAYIASHDLQEPLRMVASYVQLLSRRYRGQLDTDADEFIQYAVEGAQRMQQLINDLLAFSRVGTRGGPAAPAPAEAALAAALANLRLALEESGASLTHDPLPSVLADAGQLAQLFQNLIANALKFHGPDAPRIHIGAVRHGPEWQFSVRDNGIGLDPQFAERIFVIFQRLHTRAEYAGTGIGLAVCKKIVERHGGRIWVESQPGQGATFFFTLPGTGEPDGAQQPTD